jgi:hypothetical protein
MTSTTDRITGTIPTLIGLGILSKTADIITKKKKKNKRRGWYFNIGGD